MLSYEECKGLFGINLEIEDDGEAVETTEKTESFSGAVKCPQKKP